MEWMQEEKVAFQLQSSVLMAGEFMRIYFPPCSLSIRFREKKKSPGKQDPTEQEQIQIGPAGRGGAGPEVLFGNILERILS